MKKLLTFMLSIGMLGMASAQKDESPVDAYFSTNEMPDLIKWLPAPPDTIGAHFAYDIMQYMWGKTQRLDPERAEIAKRDAVYGIECIIQEFSEPFGLQISKEDTPQIYKVLREATATCDSICTFPKRYYMRKRPFMRMQEHTLTPDDEEALSRNGSYPSGHTILGWSAALLLMEINPDAADTLLARGLMYGESRIIVGAHWQSDVDAGRLAASAAYAKLHTSERFLEQMRLAREEFKRLTSQPTSVQSRNEISESNQTYDLSGRHVTENATGIIIQNGEKYLIKQ